MLSRLSKSNSSIKLAPYAYIIQSINHLHLQLLSTKSGQITLSIGVLHLSATFINAGHLTRMLM